MVIKFVIHPNAPQSGMAGLEAIQGNDSWLAVALESFTEEGLGGRDVTRSTEIGFDSVPLFTTQRRTVLGATLTPSSRASSAKSR